MFDLEQRAKPLLKWAGGKSGPLRQLVRFFPQAFDRYIEPFLGGGAVFFSLRKVPALLSDANPDLMELYATTRDFPEKLMRALDSMAKRYSEDFYYEVRSSTPRSAVERAARTIFLNKTGFNGLYRQNSKGKFNVPFGKRARCPKLYQRENLLAVSRRLKSAELHCGDFEALLAKAGAGDFVYCDPPYEPLSRTSSFTSYLSQRFDRGEQTRLERACFQAAQRGAIVAVSNSSAPFVLELYSRWRVERIAVKRAINSVASGRGYVDEVLALSGPLS